MHLEHSARCCESFSQVKLFAVPLHILSTRISTHFFQLRNRIVHQKCNPARQYNPEGSRTQRAPSPRCGRTRIPAALAARCGAPPACRDLQFATHAESIPAIVKCRDLQNEWRGGGEEAAAEEGAGRTDKRNGATCRDRGCRVGGREGGVGPDGPSHRPRPEVGKRHPHPRQHCLEVGLRWGAEQPRVRGWHVPRPSLLHTGLNAVTYLKAVPYLFPAWSPAKRNCAFVTLQ